MPRKPVIIKKYENRRLYDATNSRYVNLDEIARMVREGRELRVLDAATGEDLTRLVLTQIIVDDAKEPDSTFPLDVLRQMVVASGRATQENTLKYMKAVVDMYQNAYRAFTPVVSPFEFMNTRSSQGTPASEGESASTGQEQELRKRVEELEALVGKMASDKATARKNKSGKPLRESRRKS
jgi:polyhydroxyalkanoate synthesis repressor PhaR